MDFELRARHPQSTAPKGANEPIAPERNVKRHVPDFLTWQQLPEWAKDNEYIHTGFRPISNSYLGCVKSCFYVHNETGNIYSHFLATLWMLALPLYFYPYAKANYKGVDSDDWMIFGLYFLGGALCFALSTGYHTVHDVYLRLDLLGISTVTAGCFPPGMWYTFPCMARQTKIFWISVRVLHHNNRRERGTDIDMF